MVRVLSVGTAIPVPIIIYVIPRAQLYLILCMPFTASLLVAFMVQQQHACYDATCSWVQYTVIPPRPMIICTY